MRNFSGGIGLMPSPAESDKRHNYFTELTWFKFFLYLVAAIYVGAAGFVAILEPFLDLKCVDTKNTEFANPAFNGHECMNLRYLVLLGFTPTECAFARRLVASVALGGLIGWERRQADRPAGIRTMSLVSLGSCLFTINSAFAFLNGPMGWDASRVSAAIPSGVGFLGAGLIFKKEEKSDNGDSNHVVHGLTTAASLWLSAAVGIACGGDLFMPASFGVAIMLLLLRFGPRAEHEGEEDEELHEDEFNSSWKKNDDDHHHNTGMDTPPMNNVITTTTTTELCNGTLDSGDRGVSRAVRDYSSISSPLGAGAATTDELASLTSSLRGVTQTDRSAGNAAQRRKISKRSQAALASMV